jgi:hypothetical protein
MKIYNCPYCNQSTYNKTSKNTGNFTSWEAVIKHTARCKMNTGQYYIDLIVGPIDFNEINGLSYRQILFKFPNLNASVKHLTHAFKKKNWKVDSTVNVYSDEELLNFLKNFYLKYNRNPISRDFRVDKENYPSDGIYLYKFGTWNNALIQAGLIPDMISGFGHQTYGLDKYLYKSNLEARFVNKYLYKQYKYFNEIKYPNPYTFIYDFYVENIDLYIEVDGKLRPQRMIEKIKINKDLNRKLLIFEEFDFKYESLKEIMMKSYICS